MTWDHIRNYRYHYKKEQSKFAQAGNVYGLCSIGARFESRPGHRLSLNFCGFAQYLQHIQGQNGRMTVTCHHAIQNRGAYRV